MSNLEQEPLTSEEQFSDTIKHREIVEIPHDTHSS